MCNFTESVCVCVHISDARAHARAYFCMHLAFQRYTCLYVYVYETDVCVYCTHTHTHTHTHAHTMPSFRHACTVFLWMFLIKLSPLQKMMDGLLSEELWWDVTGTGVSLCVCVCVCVCVRERGRVCYSVIWMHVPVGKSLPPVKNLQPPHPPLPSPPPFPLSLGNQTHHTLMFWEPQPERKIHFFTVCKMVTLIA